MDLDDNVVDQLRSLSAWLRHSSEDGTPSALIWDQKSTGMIERADFLDRYVIDKIEHLISPNDSKLPPVGRNRQQAPTEEETDRQ